ncbi:MAG: branched-chain amino acid transport system substrate-binding protein [Acidobacteriota bacterium]|nr:branched-chain amino acid transport system substrate-binding protein [Acidobacteriota bacterium]
MKTARFLLAALLMTTACRPDREAQTGTPKGDIPVGVYGALTGGEASFGTATVNGVRMAADEINASGGIDGRKIKLFIEDDQGRAEEAASVVTKLITSDNVLGLIGENSSNQSLAAAPTAQQYGVPMISPSSTNPAVTEKGPYIFRVCFTDPYQGKALATFVRKNLDVTTAATLLDKKNDYSVGLAEFFKKEFEALGGKVIAEQSYTGGDTEFRPQLTAIRKQNPQVLFLPGFYTDVGQIAIQARDLGINVPLVGGDGWDSPAVIEIGGKSIENSYFSDHYFVNETRPAVQKFVAGYKKRYGGKNPEATAALGYDALYIFAEAMKRAGSDDRKKIRDEIAKTHAFQGIAGYIEMGPDRNPIKPVAMIKIENGQMQFAGWVKP